MSHNPAPQRPFHLISLRSDSPPAYETFHREVATSLIPVVSCMVSGFSFLVTYFHPSVIGTFVKTLIVVSGGDAPGINAAIGRFVRLAEDNGHAVVGADGGFPAAIHQPLRRLTSGELAPLAGLAGSILASSREPILAEDSARRLLAERLAAEAVDSILLFGGNGTLRHIPPLLNALGIRCVSIPTTIDNDVRGTERTLGFDSACNFAYQSVDGALATGYALPGRIFTLETLGGSCGNLALSVAHGSGAHAVLVPEVPYTHDWLAERVKAALKRDRFALVVHSEGIAETRELPDLLHRLTGTRVRDIRLGHAQRGAKPTHIDRTLAVEMAMIAYHSLLSGVRRAAVIVRDGKTQRYDDDLNLLPEAAFDEARYREINNG